MYIGIQQYRDKPYYHKLHNSTHTRTWRFRHTTYQPPPPRTKATILQWSSRSQAPSPASSPSAATVPSPRGAPSACRPALRAGTRGGRLPALRFLRQRPPCPLWPCTLQQTCDMAYVHRVLYGPARCSEHATWHMSTVSPMAMSHVTRLVFRLFRRVGAQPAARVAVGRLVAGPAPPSPTVH